MKHWCYSTLAVKNKKLGSALGWPLTRWATTSAFQPILDCQALLAINGTVKIHILSTEAPTETIQVQPRMTIATIPNKSWFQSCRQSCFQSLHLCGPDWMRRNVEQFWPWWDQWQWTACAVFNCIEQSGSGKHKFFSTLAKNSRGIISWSCLT